MNAWSQNEWLDDLRVYEWKMNQRVIDRWMSCKPNPFRREVDGLAWLLSVSGVLSQRFMDGLQRL